MLEVAGLVEECCRVASNGAWRSCKSARQACALHEDSCQAWPCSWYPYTETSVSLFLLLTVLNSSYCSLLPWGSLAQLMPHTAVGFHQAPLRLAVLGPPYLPAQTQLNRADVLQLAVM